MFWNYRSPKSHPTSTSQHVALFAKRAPSKMPYPVPLSHNDFKPPTLPATTSGPNIVILPIQRHSAITSVSAPAAIFIIIAYVAYTSRPTTVPSLHPWSSLQPAGDLRTWTLQQGHLFFRQLAFRNTPVRPSGSSASVYGRSERAGLSGLLVAFHNHSACHDHREAHHRLAKTWDLMGEGGAETGGDH